MKGGSLFSGTGALDMAAGVVLGCEPAWFVEQNPAAAKVLAYHWPNVPNHGDITAVNWSSVEPVDVLTGGFPCQDISNAGKRAGIEGERSGLWSYFADAIRVLRPRYVLVENVSALVVRGLDRVLADLAALGFDAEWAAVRASDVGAAHRRERIFLVAGDAALLRRDHPSTAGWGHQPTGALRGSGGDAARADSGRVRQQSESVTGRGGETVTVVPGAVGAVAHASGDGRGEGRPEPAGQFGRPDAAECGGVIAADADLDQCAGQRLQQPGEAATAGRGARTVIDGGVNWREYGPAIRQHERLIGRPAPAPTIVGKRGGPKLSPYFTEWLMGLPEGFVTSVPGLSVNDMLRLCGNGVVAQQATAAYRYLLPLLSADREVAA